MKRFFRLILSLAGLLLPAVMFAAGDMADTSTAVFSPDVKSLTVNIEGDRLAPPVLILGSTDKLKIGFDILSEEREYLRYSISLCNADWSQGQLIDNEVFDGFNYADIENYAFSRATSTHYVHYNVTLPNDDFRFNLSGNYLLKIYPEENPDETLLQVRFMVQEAAVAVGGSVSSITDYGVNDCYQQLSLIVDVKNTPVRDIYTDLKILVTQSGRLDNAVTVTHPSRVTGTRAIFEHKPELIFPAGNEYRRMETVNNLYPGMGEDHIEYHAPRYYHILNLDKARCERNYQYDQTQFGRYFIREYNSENSDVEADYVMTMFTLDIPREPDAEIYLDGDFVLRRFDSTSRMEYNFETQRYEKLMLLKQGAYNYQYLTVDNRCTERANRSLTSNPIATTDIEGCHYETNHEYLVYVYYRSPGDRYDRLLGVGALH